MYLSQIVHLLRLSIHLYDQLCLGATMSTEQAPWLLIKIFLLGTPVPSLPRVTLPSDTAFLNSDSITFQKFPGGDVCTAPFGAVISYI